MIFEQIRSGGDRNFSYLIACSKTMKGVLVDPSPDPCRVDEAVRNSGVKIRFIINTHSHSDHSGGNHYFGKQGGKNPISFINCGGDTAIKDGQILDMGEISFQFLAAPGHTEDSICILTGSKMITGDTLFVGKVGGTWSKEDAEAEFKSLRKIMLLSPQTEVWPGHDYGISPSSTIGAEIKENPFIKRLYDFEDFLWLKQNWTQYKREKGIR